MYQTIKVAIEGGGPQSSSGVATVSLNRPDVRNAFHPTMIRELTEAFREIAARVDIAVICLRGEGKSFCSGADLGYMQSMAAFTLEENQKDSDQLFEMFWALRSCPQPVVGLVHGHVMGGALGLLAVCDIAASVEGTQFCFSEVRLGLAPAVISPFVLERVPAGFARRYLLTAEVFGPQEALASGLLQYNGTTEEAEAFVAKTVLALRQNGVEAVRSTKTLLRAFDEVQDWEQRRKLTTRVIAERRVSEEGQEGLRGFLEKRQPNWRTV